MMVRIVIFYDSSSFAVLADPSSPLYHHWRRSGPKGGIFNPVFMKFITLITCRPETEDIH